MGSATGRGPVPAKTTDQSNATPRTQSSAAESRNRSGPPWSRRSVPATTERFPAPTEARVSSIGTVSTPCGDTSTNTVCPSSARRRVASSKRTVSRRLVTQYSASSPAVSNQSPVTVDSSGTVPVVRGRTGASSSTNSSRRPSTWGECEA